MSPEPSWSRVRFVEGVTSLVVLTNGSAIGVKEDALLLRSVFIVRSIHHHKTTVTYSLQRRAEVESIKGDLAEPKRFLTADMELTVEFVEGHGSLSLTLDGRQKSMAKRGTLCNLATHVRVTTL